jgi:hypothetical protein
LENDLFFGLFWEGFEEVEAVFLGALFGLFAEDLFFLFVKFLTQFLT